jgi:hypothetical protein
MMSEATGPGGPGTALKLKSLHDIAAVLVTCSRFPGRRADAGH